MLEAAGKQAGRGRAPILSALNAAVTFAEGVAVRFSALGVLAMMVVVVIDVLGRYLFNSPLTWSYDLVSIYLMPFIMFLALSNTFRRNNHISVDILYANFGATMKRLSRFLTALIVLATVTPIAWLAYLQAVGRYASNSMIAGSILWPTWIPSAFLAAGTALLILRALLDGVALAAGLATRREDIPGESPERALDREPGDSAT